MRSDQKTKKIDRNLNFSATKSVSDYIEAHRYRSGFNTILPKFVHQGLYGDYKANTFALLTHLQLLGLDQQVEQLGIILKEESLSSDSHRLAEFLDYLYDLFDVLSQPKGKLSESNDNLSESNDRLSETENKEVLEYEQEFKTLKKLTHKFARENGFSRRLFNLEKLEIKLKSEKKRINSEIPKTVEIYKKYKQEQLEHIKQKLNYIETLRKEYPERKYAYIPKNNIEYINPNQVQFKVNPNNPNVNPIPVDEKQKKQLNIEPLSTEEEREERRKKKRIIRALSIIASLIVGLSEGIVAAVFALATLPVFVAFLLIGGPGFVSNFYLFSGDSYSIFKDIYFGRIFKKPNGEPLSLKEKVFVSLTLVLSLSGAALFGILSFSTGLVAWPLIFGLIGLSAGPAVVIVVPAVIAIITAICLFAVFGTLTVNWVRNDGPRKLKENILNFPKKFIHFWKPEKSWNTLSKGEKARHVTERIVTVLSRLLFFALAVAAVLISNASGIGQFKFHTHKVFTTVFHWSQPFSKVMTTILVAVGGVAAAIFYGNGMINKVLVPLKNTLILVGSAILHPVKAYKSIQAEWKRIEGSPVRKINCLWNTFLSIVLYGTAVLNGAGQGMGVMFNKSSISEVGSGTGGVLSGESAADCAGVSVAVASAGVNINGIKNALRGVKSLPTKTIRNVNDAMNKLNENKRSYIPKPVNTDESKKTENSSLLQFISWCKEKIKSIGKSTKDEAKNVLNSPYTLFSNIKDGQDSNDLANVDATGKQNETISTVSASNN